MQNKKQTVKKKTRKKGADSIGYIISFGDLRWQDTGKWKTNKITIDSILGKFYIFKYAFLLFSWRRIGKISFFKNGVRKLFRIYFYPGYFGNFFVIWKKCIIKFDQHTNLKHILSRYLFHVFNLYTCFYLTFCN